MNRRTFMALPGLALAARPHAAGQRTPPKSEFDYVDWSWQRWREITGEARPVVTSAQSGKAELIDLAGAQTETRRVLNVFLGEPPRAKADLAVRSIEETQAGAFVRRTVSYEVEPGERISAYVLSPKNLRGRAPAVLCPHQTTQAGRKEPAGLAGNPELHTALRLVERGYVALTYDALGFAERHDAASGHYGDAIPFYRRMPQWSLLGKMAWDLSRGVDYLQTLDFVDPQRIGSIGHSHGGITTLWGMALDERIRAGVSNCGFDTFRIDGNLWRWSHATALMPRLGFYVSSPHITMDNYRAVPDSEVIQVPFDQHMMLALIAPRPLLLSTSDDDFVFPNGGWSARRSLARLAPVYKALGAADRLEGHFFAAGHSFPAPVSARAYVWLDRWLKA
jgi:dienelactone hydrolase